MQECEGRPGQQQEAGRERSHCWFAPDVVREQPAEGQQAQEDGDRNRVGQERLIERYARRGAGVRGHVADPDVVGQRAGDGDADDTQRGAGVLEEHRLERVLFATTAAGHGREVLGLLHRDAQPQAHQPQQPADAERYPPAPGLQLLRAQNGRQDGTEQ